MEFFLKKVQIREARICSYDYLVVTSFDMKRSTKVNTIDNKTCFNKIISQISAYSKSIENE